jgi:hypothetical protein
LAALNPLKQSPTLAGRLPLPQIRSLIMGMHIGLIAAKCSIAKFRDAFSQTWPQLEMIESADKFPNPEAVWAWMKANEQFVSAADWSKDNPGKQVYVFWPDGDWAMMLDTEYTRACDVKGLKRLSVHLGDVVSFVVETAGGSAFFWCCQDGKLVRRICYSDGDVSLEGTPLPEESGIDVSNFYMDETEALWKAFGLSPYEAMKSTDKCEAICVVDRTDYENP